MKVAGSSPPRPVNFPTWQPSVDRGLLLENPLTNLVWNKNVKINIPGLHICWWYVIISITVLSEFSFRRFAYMIVGVSYFWNSASTFNRDVKFYTWTSNSLSFIHHSHSRYTCTLDVPPHLTVCVDLGHINSVARSLTWPVCESINESRRGFALNHVEGIHTNVRVSRTLWQSRRNARVKAH